MADIRYQVTRYGTGFNGPGQRWLGRAIRILGRKLRGIEGPYTIDDPENPNDATTQRNRRNTLDKVKERLANAEPNLKLVVRGVNYDEAPFAIRKADLSVVGPLVQAAKRYLGNTYLLGAVPPPRSDCSGLTLKVVQEVYGVDIPHLAYAQAEMPDMWTFQDPTNLQVDDFIFYVYGRLGRTIDHVALFVEPGQEIGARPSAGGVAITAIDWNNVVKFGRFLPPR